MDLLRPSSSSSTQDTKPSLSAYEAIILIRDINQDILSIHQARRPTSHDAGIDRDAADKLITSLESLRAVAQSQLDKAIS